jgi:RepB DNA-primase from phage plasmid
MMADLTKEQKEILRHHLDSSAVAEKLGWLGEIPASCKDRNGHDRYPLENSVDFVMHANREQGRDISFADAMAWLHQEFPNVERDRERIIDVKPLEVRDDHNAQAEYVTNEIVGKTMDALGCNTNRITMKTGKGWIDENGDKIMKALIPGRDKGGDNERFYDADGIKNMVRFLRSHNDTENNRQDILITPMSDSTYYILVDDARMTSGAEPPSGQALVDDWRTAGYAPCLAIQTSRDSHQLVFKVPRSAIAEIAPNQDVAKRAINTYAASLNMKFGDKGLNFVDGHTLRLPGYRNMKFKHGQDVEGKAWSKEWPFVKLTAASPTFCRKSIEDAVACAREYVKRSGVEDLLAGDTSGKGVPPDDAIKQALRSGHKAARDGIIADHAAPKTATAQPPELTADQVQQARIMADQAMMTGMRLPADVADILARAVEREKGAVGRKIPETPRSPSGVTQTQSSVIAPAAPAAPAVAAVSPAPATARRIVSPPPATYARQIVKPAQAPAQAIRPAPPQMRTPSTASMWPSGRPRIIVPAPRPGNAAASKPASSPGVTSMPPGSHNARDANVVQPPPPPPPPPPAPRNDFARIMEQAREAEARRGQEPTRGPVMGM